MDAFGSKVNGMRQVYDRNGAWGYRNEATWDTWLSKWAISAHRDTGMILLSVLILAHLFRYSGDTLQLAK
jgi:hypothetical protein